MLEPREYHAGNPKEYYIVCGHEHVGGIKIVEVGGFVGISERGERPKRGTEPGVEHVVVLTNFAAAVRARRNILFANRHFAATVAVKRGYAVSPPKLTANAPIADILHPVQIYLFEAFGQKLYALIVYHFYGGPGERFHLHVPLPRNHGLYHGVASAAMPHVVVVIFDFYEQSLFLEVGNHSFASLEPVEPRIRARVFRHCAVVIHNAYRFESVALPHLEIVGVVRRRYLHRARAEIALHVFVGDYGYLSADERQHEIFAYRGRIPLVFGIYRNGSVAEHGFGARCGNGNISVLAVDFVFYVPKVRGGLLVFHLHVRYSGFTARAPIGNTVAAVNKPFII